MVRLITEAPPRSRRQWLFGVGGIVAGMYLLLIWAPFYVFGPRLEITEIVMPGTIKPCVPFSIGFSVKNSRWGDGAAYVVFLVDGETEVEGPVIRISARGETNVLATLTLDTGVRVASIFLYDATRRNTRLDGRNGIQVVVGSEPIRLTDVSYPATIIRGETMTVRFWAAVDRAGPFDVLPLVIVSDSRGRFPVETEGEESLIDTGMHVLEAHVPTDQLSPGTHLLTAGLFNPGDRRWIGQKVSRRELEVISP